MADFNLFSTKGKVLKLHKDLVFAASGTSKSFTFQVNGVLKAIILKIPNVTDAPSATITIVDENSITVFTLASLAENTTHTIRYDTQAATVLPLAVPICGECTCTVEFTGAPGVSTTEVELYFN